MENKDYFKYWGKASKEDGSYHLLPYHCLDVAAVSEMWWLRSPNIRRSFIKSTGLTETQARAWVLFFIALHDYGKFDLRFQRKAPEAWKQVNPELNAVVTSLRGLDIKKYYHGSAGLYWFYQDNYERFGNGDGVYCFDDNEDWLAPIMGHHGSIPGDDEKESDEYRLFNVPENLRKQFKLARISWLNYLARLFLSPAGLSLEGSPPIFNTTKNGQSASTILAGFCSVCDWLGSSDFFQYDDQPSDNLTLWYKQRILIGVPRTCGDEPYFWGQYTY